MKLICKFFGHKWTALSHSDRHWKDTQRWVKCARCKEER